MRRLAVRLFCFAVAAGLLCACMDVRTPEVEPVPPARPAAPMLTMEHAQARSARVDAVAYDLEFELDGEAKEYAGRVSTTFELNGADNELTVDFIGGTVASVRVNGRAIDAPYNGYFLTLPGSTLTTGPNTVEIAFSHPYSTDGSGLYRFRDPVDGRDYLYTDFEPYDQNRLFPSFDQPDLKATYTTRVSVPSNWQVVSIVAESDIADQGEKKLWSFPPSARISTYIYALHAGEYQSWESAAGDVPLRLFARASLAEYVHPEHWFVPTRQGLEFFGDYFEIPYPFGKYDQVIVPHFNSGAMENVGAVTFSERFLSRGTVTRQARRALASVILHEMAHMWFGNLVTMDWWNGLWLNESFATFMATLALVEATEFTEARLGAYRSTVRAYGADERDTTHPIELPTPNTDAAFANFDAITYSKGSATLTQLNHLVGPEAFRRGVSAYLESHVYGNTTIDDFLAAIAEASERDLDDWAAEWLNEPGTNGVEVEFDCEGGVVGGMAIVQTAPPSWPTLRTHRTQLGLYNFENGEVAVRLAPVTYAGVHTEVAAASGERCPDFVYANHGDWDYARADFDEAALATLGHHLNDFDDPLARSMLWQGVYEMVLYQRLSPGEFVDFALANIGGEADVDVTRQVLDALQSAWFYVRRLSQDAEAVAEMGAVVETYLWQAFHDSEPGSDRQLLLYGNYAEAVQSADGLDRLVGLLAGEGSPEGLYFDQDLRWGVVEKLGGFGHPKAEALLAAERASDPSDQGRRQALSAEAARPDRAQQRRMMNLLLDPASDLSVADARAYADGLFPENQQEAQLEIVGEVFDSLQSVSDDVDPGYFGPITGGLLGTVCDQGYLDRLEQAVNRSDTLHPSLRKRLLDMRFEVKRCLAISETMALAR